MPLSWLIAILDLAAAAAALWVASELDFFDTGLNGWQVLAAAVGAMLLLTAVALAWPRAAWLPRAAFGLNALALAVLLAVSAWTALTAGTSGNPMAFYWRHAAVLAALFGTNLAGAWWAATRGAVA